MAQDFSDALVRQLPPATVSFFAMFSRFEFALKRSKYSKTGGPGGVSADWEAFSKNLGKKFFDKIRESGKASTFLSKPPKKQVLADGDLSWKAVANPSNVNELFGAIRRVRNNLLHGAKYSTGVEADAIRDQRLLEEASWVLHVALEEVEQIREQFVQPVA
jgi:hypothetical protein